MFETMSMVGTVPNGSSSKDALRFKRLGNLLCSRPGVLTGDKCVFVDEKYVESVCVIRRVERELKAKKDYCKVYDVIIESRNVTEQARCIYFGSVVRVCISRGKKYEKFDEFI